MHFRIVSLYKSLFTLTDIAVGAPNADAVYVYRSYPVVKVLANVYPLSKELKTTDKSFNFKVCWSLESKYKILDQTSKCQCLHHCKQYP